MEVKKKDNNRLSLAEQNIMTIQRDLLELKDSYKGLEILAKRIDELNISILTLTEKFDARYASKKTEDNLSRVNWIIISAVIVALLGLVITKN